MRVSKRIAIGGYDARSMEPCTGSEPYRAVCALVRQLWEFHAEVQPQISSKRQKIIYISSAEVIPWQERQLCSS